MNVIRSLTGLFAYPRVEERETYGPERIVYVVAVAVLLGLGVLSAYRVLNGETRLLIPIISTCVACVVSLELLRRQRVNAAGLCLSWSLMAFLDYLAWTSNGLTDSALFAAPGILVFSGLVFKRRSFFLFAGTWLLSIAFLGYMQLKGMLHVVLLSQVGYSDILDMVVIFGITAITVRLLTDGIIKSLEEARSSEREVRRQSERMIESEARYRALFEGAQDAILIMDEHGFVECNSTATKMFGCRDRSEIIGKGAWDFSPPQQPDGSDSRDKAQLIIRDVLRGHYHRMNWKHRRKDGTSFDAEIVLSCLNEGVDGLVQAVVRDITERIASENALRRSDERYRLLFNSIQDAVFVHGVRKDGLPDQFLEANEVACRRLGYKREELLKMSPTDIDAPDTIARVPDAIRKVTADGSATWEGAHVSRDGRRIPVEITNHVFNLEGKMTIIATARDITERKVVENALRESEEKFRTIVETTSEWIWGWSTGGVHTYSNPAVETILGYRPVDLTGKNISDFMHEDDWSTVGGLLPICVKERKGWRDLVLRWRHKDGSYRYLESNATPVLDREGDVIGFRGADRDITDRKFMEDRLRMSEEYYRTLVETSPDAIIIVDPGGFISFVSPRGYELFAAPNGYSAIGTSVLDWVSAEARTTASGLFADSLAGRVKLSAFEIDLLRYDRSQFRAEISSSLLVNNKGEIRGQLIICRDVSGRVEAEHALRQAQRMESIGILAGGIAHDFNNLLQAILGQTHLALSKMPSGDAGRANIEKAERAAERAAELTRQLLAYSGQGRLSMRVVDVNATILENLHLLEFGLPRNVGIELALSDAPLVTKGDQSQIYQVIANLVSNAAEAYESHGGIIRVSSSRQTIEPENVGSWTRAGAEIDPGEYVVLEVQDKGCGMDAATTARIFDPFFSTKFTGRGLGLAAVLGIVRGHRGALQVESAKGAGTIFRVAFPQSEQIMQPDQTPAPGASRSSGRTILLIDDEEVVRDVFSETLTDAGWNIITAADGEEGLQAFRQHTDAVSLIVLDLSMPGMDGAETLRRLRVLDPAVKVVLSSGYGEEDAMGRFEGLGLSGFLQKPYQWGVLKDTLESFLHSAR